MRYKSFVFLFVVMPFFVMSQSSSTWYLFVNRTNLVSSSVDSVASVQLSKKIKGEIKIAFAERDTRFIRTVVMMNTTRQTFLQKKLTAHAKTASFLVADVLAKSNAKPFVIYIVDVPADTKKLMGIRIMPVAICKVDWKE